MLSYALLMALLYGGENKNLKTWLIIGIVLALLVGKTPKKIRRPRSRRARRIMARRAAERHESGGNTFDKIQKWLPIVTTVLEMLANRVRDINLQKQGTGNVAENSTENIDEEYDEEEDIDSSAEENLFEDSVQNEKDRKNSGLTKEDINSIIIKKADEEKPEENIVAEVEENKDIIIEENKEIEKEENKEIEKKENKDIIKEENKDVIAEENRDEIKEVTVYKVEEKPISIKENDITATIKEIFHGTNVTLGLVNGQTLNGEVIGEYNGILILRSSGIINYIRGESIARFH